MNVALYLLIGHFLADYPLQTNWVAQKKGSNGFAFLTHLLTHLLTYVLILSPFLYEKKVWVAIGFVFLIHAFTDKIKLIYQKKSRSTFLAYLIDQFTHVSSALLASVWVGDLAPACDPISPLYIDISFLLFILTLLIFTYFYDVTMWAYQTSKNSNLPFKRNYNLMMRNAILVMLIFGSYWILGSFSNS